MHRYGIDAHVLLRLGREAREPAATARLVAPNRVLSDVLALLYADVRAGTTTRAEALRLLDHLATIKIRLLGDRTSRAAALRIATDLDLEDPARAEYLAVTSLQAEALVTLDPVLARAAEGIVEIAPFEALLAGWPVRSDLGESRGRRLQREGRCRRNRWRESGCDAGS